MNWTIPRALAAGLVLFSLSGCITMKTLGKAKDEFGDGNIGSGLFYTLISPLMIVPDVFTLGGTTDPSVVAGTAMGAAATYSASKSTSSSTPARTVSTPTPALMASSTTAASITSPASSSQYAAGGVSNSNAASTGSGTKTSNNSGTSSKPASGTNTSNPPTRQKVNVPGRSECLRTTDASRSRDVETMWFYSIENTCGETLNAHWCESAGCTRADEAWELPPGGKRENVMTAASRESARIRMWACPLRYNGQEVNFDGSAGQCWAWSS